MKRGDIVRATRADIRHLPKMTVSDMHPVPAHGIEDAVETTHFVKVDGEWRGPIVQIFDRCDLEVVGTVLN